MNRTVKFMNNILIKEAVGDRGLRVYRKPVDGRLGINGLSKLVLEETGHEPKGDEAYVFFPKNQDMIRILSVDHIGVSMVELFGMKAKEMKEELIQMDLI